MKSARALRILGLTVVTAIASPFALADDLGWYGGANIGRSSANIDNAKITSNLLGAGFATTGITNDDSDTGYKILGGYKFNKNFALEGGYFDLGKFGYLATTVPAGSLSGNIRLDGWNLDAVGILPISDKFSAIARLGFNYVEAKDTFSGTGLVNPLNRNPSKRELNYKYGVGLQYDFNAAIAMRAEAERYRINDAVGSKGDIDLFSLGLIYRFGR